MSIADANYSSIVPLHRVKPQPRRVAIGEFDAIHVGEQAILAEADTALAWRPAVDEGGMPSLMSPDLRVEALARVGIRELVLVDSEYGHLGTTPSAFIDNILIERLDARQVLIAEGCRFGTDGGCSVADLQARSDFKTKVIEPAHRFGERVTSSLVRRFLAEGSVERVASCLGIPFRIRGRVVAGERRGRTLGFPTANVAIQAGYAYPALGVYACRILDRPAAVSVGVRPTFGSGMKPNIEAHILDFDGDLYGEQLTVSFIARLRPERRFASARELVDQLEHDIESVRHRVPE